MPVLKDERQDRIMQLLYKEGKAVVTELCMLLNVSPATVRRDIEELDAKKLVKRTHGGIVLPDSTKLETPVVRRRYFQANEKRAIGKAAAELIQDNETVFLGSGTTVLEVAKNLQARRISPLLPTPTDYQASYDAPHINLIITGGFLRQAELSMIGHIVETSLSELRADKVVMSIQAIHRQHGLTNNDLAETRTDRTICHFSPTLILVADHTKFDKTNASFVAELSAIHTLVTDSNATN